VNRKKEDGTISVGGRDSTRGLSKFTGVGVRLLSSHETIRQAAQCLPACREIEPFWTSSLTNLR